MEKDAVVMLNITGGGEELFKKGRKLHYLKPAVIFNINPSLEEIDKKTKGMF
jgi:cysteate synthase